MVGVMKKQFVPETVVAAKNATSSGGGANRHLHATSLLKRRQVAEQLGVCEHTVQRLTRKGILPALVFNPRLIRYLPEAVEALIAQAKVG